MTTWKTLRRRAVGEYLLAIPCPLADRLSAPIAELMKTPSRTATSKKTRATETANKNRAEQIRQFNIALSPFSKAPAVCSPQRAMLISGTHSFLPFAVAVRQLYPPVPDALSSQGQGKGPYLFQGRQ